MGRDVENLQGDELGKVTDLALDMKNGRILAVIISTGGFLGLDREMVGVPPGAFTNFKAGGEHGTLLLDSTRENFKAAPNFKKNGWAAYFQVDHCALLFRYFKVVPYFQASKRELSGMSLGPVKSTHDVLGLPIRDDQHTLGNITAIRVDSKTERLMYMVVTNNDAISSKFEILASEVQLNAAQNAMEFDVSKQAGSGFRQPTLGR